MAKYNVGTTGIESGTIYRNVGVQSVIYNSVTYTTGQTFRGVLGVTTFSYSGSGSQIVNEIVEVRGAFIEFIQNSTEYPSFDYDAISNIKDGFIEFVLNPLETAVQETTIINDGGIEYAGQPSMTFSISRRVPLLKSIPPVTTLATRIAYFGDSMTDTAFLAYDYPAKIAALHPALAYTNYGISGNRVCTNTYAPVGGNHNLIDQYTTEIALGYTGQLVSFALGENDTAQSIVNATWKATYKSIIQAFITAGFPLNRLMIMTEPSHSSLATSRAQARTYIAEIAAELGIMFYNVYQRFLDTGINDTFYSSSDSFIHPNDAGQIVWASGYDTFLRR